ncbi:unnamed protein product [Auanema sp. JU1783]|nr:unnamed protein product [Auanema sp. JU1783]
MTKTVLLQTVMFVTWFVLAETQQASLLKYPAIPPISDLQDHSQQSGKNPVSLEGKNTAFTSAYSNQDLSDDFTKLLTDIAERVKNYGKNPFLPESNLIPSRVKRESTSHSDADLREAVQDQDEEKEPEEGFIKEPDVNHHISVDEDTEEAIPSSSSSKRDYCERYEQHYSYFCVGESNTDDPSVRRFCPSYQNNCPDMARKSPLTPWPADPFSGPVKAIPKQDSTETAESESVEVDEKTVYYEELRRRFPCKPDCDPRIFPHCTAECKCDYIYPMVQKFCNPPPIPLFLNTCRLWYNGCPKYDRYHYASQFVYNKANKGKVSPGTRLTDIHPYGIERPSFSPNAQSAQPFPRPQRTTSHLMPIMHAAKTVVQEPELVIPPDLPVSPPRASGIKSETASNQKLVETDSNFNNEHRSSTKASRSINEHNSENSRTSSKSHSSHHHHHHSHRSSTNSRSKSHKKRRSRSRETSFASAFETEHSTESPKSTQLSRKELYNKLKVLNDLTMNPVGITKKLEDPGTISKLMGIAGTTTQTDDRPKAAAAATTDEETDPFKNVDRWSGLTDSHGIYHRPRSSSPFTKPGLWEPNPDDPHSRDPANKYWYHPESVGVDWLNGQMTWGAHWAVPAAGVGGTDGFSAIYFPTIGSFLNIPDDYD